MQVIDVVVNCADLEEAKRISDELISERLVACSNIFSPIESRYYWKGEIRDAREVPLLVKTAEELWGAVARRIGEIHSYETPSIIRMNVDDVNKSYAEWIYAETLHAK